MTDRFPDKVSPEEKARRRRVIHGWTNRLDEHSTRFAQQCMNYLKGYTDTPPPGYKDDQEKP